MKAVRRLNRIIVIALSLHLAPLIAFIPFSEAGLRDQVVEARLSNGLKVLLLENHKAPLVSFQVWYRAGSRHESWGKTGLAHVLEHLMFKGTTTRSGEQFIRAIQENGGTYNAFTSHDFAAYFEELSSDRLQVSLDLESDRMKNLVLREDDFRTERLVVIEERRLRVDDNPAVYLLEQLEATAYQTQPYHWPTIGWIEDLSRLALEDAKAFYRAFYDPSNAFIVIAGDFRKDRLLPQLEKAFGSIPKGPEPDRTIYRDPPQTGERRIVVEKEAQLPTIIMGFHAPNILNSDNFVLDVITSLLSNGKSSRLHENLVRGKVLALEADAEYSQLSIDPSLFLISATVLPGKEIADVESAIDQELERLRKEPVGADELEKAKNQIETDFLFSQDSLFFQGMLLAQYEIALDWKAIDDYLPSIRKVTPEDVMTVAQRYLVPSNRTVGILRPIPGREGKPAPEGQPLKERFIQ